MTNRRTSLLATCAAALACFGCDGEGRTAPAGAAAQAADTAPSGRTVFERAQAAIKKHRLTQIPGDCLELKFDSGASTEIDVVDVYELHNEKCGGDPEVQPRLFTLHLSRTHARVWTDAKSEDGELQLLPE